VRCLSADASASAVAAVIAIKNHLPLHFCSDLLVLWGIKDIGHSRTIDHCKEFYAW